jgi:16S rRNA processing protein RimM
MTVLQLADHVLVARIGAVYGVKGWVKLISFTDPPKNILGYQKFMTLQRDGQGEKLMSLTIDQSKSQGKDIIAHIKGCDDRELARSHTGSSLYLPKSALPELGASEFYWYQLQGLRVINRQGEDLGKVSYLLETGANDVLVVQGDTSSIDEEERLIPYLRDQVIEQVDLEQGLIRVSWEKDFLRDRM